MIRTDKQGRRTNCPAPRGANPAGTKSMQENEEAIPVIPVQTPPMPTVGNAALYELIPSIWKQPRVILQIDDSETRRTVRALARDHGDQYEATDVMVIRNDVPGEIFIVTRCSNEDDSESFVSNKILMPHEINANAENINEYLCIATSEALYQMDSALWELKPEVADEEINGTATVVQAPIAAPAVQDIVKLNLIELEVLCPKDAEIDVERFEPLLSIPVKFVLELQKYAKEIEDGSYAKGPPSDSGG